PLNACTFGPDGRIYLSCGSMNRMGQDPVRPETPLSAAVVVADVRNPGFNGGVLPLNVQTTSPVRYNAFASNAPLKPYATGFREMYKPAWHSNGSFYGGVNQNDGTERAESPSGPGVPSLRMIFPDEDLVRIVPGAYYGHPNPSRNQIVVMGGNPTSGRDPWEVPEYPVGVRPDPKFNPANLLFNLASIGGTSANGCAEYTGSGPLRGRLLVCFYETKHTIHTFAFNAAGTAVTDQRPILDESGNPLTLNHPLDLAVHPSGRIYVADFGAWATADQGAGGGIWMLTAAPDAGGGGSGGGTGLTGEYYDGPGFTQFRGTQVDPTVNFSWDSPAPDEFSARWTGFVQPRYSETYTFHAVSDDGVRLWIDGRLVIDDWMDHNTREARGTIAMTADRRTPLRMEYYKNGNHGEARLSWSSARQAREIVPQSRLFTSAGTSAGTGGGGAVGGGTGTSTGFTGKYYDGVNFTNLIKTQTDPVIDFTFQSAVPDDFSVIWTGNVAAPTSEVYTFRTLTDDGVRLWVDGRLLIDHWQEHNPAWDSGTIALTAGRQVPLRMEYYKNGNAGEAHLYWSSPTRSE
ncbi:MAG: PA14 domain-containing protein, partial [Actinomycetota bacterium]